MDEDLIARFWSKIDRLGPIPAHAPELGRCWLWTDRPNHGYGRLLVLETRKLLLAHRLSWMIHRGDPGDMFVCHSCDNRICVNPEHLFLGTNADNMHDMAAKGRRKGIPATMGETHGMVKLREADVRAIRASTRSSRELADEYGVTYGLVWSIRKRRVWRHVA